MRAHAVTASSSALLVALLAAAPPALAAWPVARGDAGRTAFSPEAAALAVPEVRWRVALGGRLGPDDLMIVAAPDGSGPLLVMVEAERIVARRPDDALAWRAEALLARDLLGAWDLDGDGAAELVAIGRHRGGTDAVFVVDPADGALRWASPSGAVGALRGTVRVADLDGDGRPDVYAADGSPSLPGSVPYAGAAWSFAAGYGAPAGLWTLQPAETDYWARLYDALGDLDGDGAPELLFQGREALYVVDGQSGAVVASADAGGKLAAATSRTVLVDADGDGDQEAVLFAPGGWSATFNAVRVFLVDVDPATRAPAVAWDRAAADPAAARLAYDEGSVADVDGDGAAEVVVSFAEGAGAPWVLEVRDLASGALERALEGEEYVATFDLDGDGRAEVLARDAAGALRALDLSGEAPAVAAALPDARVLRCLERGAARATATRQPPCALAVPGAGGDALLVGTPSGEDAVGDVRAVRVVDGALATVASFTPAEGTRFRTWGIYPGAAGDGSGALVGLVDAFGHVVVLDAGLAPLNYEAGGAFAAKGVPVRGYDPGYGGLPGFPVAADLDGDGVDEVLAVTTEPRVVAFDVRGATTIGGAVERWSVPDGRRAAVARRAEGAPVAVVATSEAVVGVDGAAGWTVPAFPAEPGVTLHGDLLPVDLDGGGDDEVTWLAREAGTGTYRLVRVTPGGAPVGDVAVDTNSGGVRRLAAGDLDGAGAPALVAGRLNQPWRLDAETGGHEILGTTGLGQVQLVVDPGDGGGATVLCLDRDGPERVDGGGAGLLWSAPADLSTPVMGAAVPCPGGPLYVGPAAFSPALRAWTVAAGEVAWAADLAGGEAWPLGEAPPAVAGALGNATGIGDLTGEGVPAVVVGSTDGWLYAVGACDGALRWALRLGAAAREIAVADWDGDGAAELVAAATDGRIYGVDTQVLAAPAEVRDLDPQGPAPAADVDARETWDTLDAAWDPVAGAEGYDVAVLGPGGEALTPAPVAVGPAPEATVPGLPLALGARYVVAVRARGPAGVGSYAVSDGLTVVDVSPPEAAVTVAPAGAAEGEPVALGATASDRTGLAAWRLALAPPGGGAEAVLWDEAAEGPAASREATWTVPEGAAPGLWEAVLAVTDVGGHTAIARATLEVRPPAPVGPEPADTGSPVADEAPAEAAGAGAGGGDGCACRGGADGPGGSAPIALALLLLAGRAAYFSRCSCQNRARDAV